MNPSDPHGQGARLSQQATANAANGDVEEPVSEGRHFRLFLRAQLSWMTSAVVHLGMLLILAFVVLPERKTDFPDPIDIVDAEPIEPFDPPPPLPDLPLPPDDSNAEERSATIEMAALSAPALDDPVGLVPDVDAGIPDLEPGFAFDRLFPPGGGGGRVHGNGPKGDDLVNRRMRRNKIKDTLEDIAVAAALRWLAAHQMPDGSWNFDHTRGACQGRCANAGSLDESPRAATALALMTFLGAGQTHMEGNFQATVRRGLAFLIRGMALGTSRGSLEEPGGSMYSHGLGAIALCEAYAITHDGGLRQPAQYSLDYITYAQDPVGGGWRYRARQPGDTSVFGWQFMALKSGHLAYLHVNPQTVQRAVKFLDAVQAESGARYGYTGPSHGATTTSVGLLCRMYSGWNHEHPALERGVQWLAGQGPSQNNMYYNYYATQVLHHYGGELWDGWDKQMKPHLLKTQSKEGHQAGSWYFNDPHGGSKGGRLYNTTLAAMTLEVYYRYLPMYQRTVVEDDFQF